MKTLYLIRHAKSSWADPGISDLERPLNKRGKRDAPFMGEQLRKRSVSPDLIITSPAKRARKTAGHIGRGVGYSKKEIVVQDSLYTSDVEDLLQVIQQSDRHFDTVFLVGHNYVITECAELLSGQSFSSIPTAGIAAIEFSITDWRDAAVGKGRLIIYDYPKKHK